MKVYYLRTAADTYRGVLVSRGDWSNFFDQFNGHPIEYPLPDVTISWDPTSLRLPKGDYPSLFSHIPMFTKRAVLALSDMLEGNGELIPVTVSDEEHYLFNVTRVIDALDESRSRIIRFPDSTRVMDIEVHYFFAEEIDEAPIFKIPQVPTMDVFVTDEFVSRVKSARLKGFEFPFLWSLDETGETASEVTIFD